VTTTRGARVLAWTVALILTASGCGRSPAASTPDGYVLTTVDGASLPALLDERVVAGPSGDELHRIEATAGTLELAQARYALELRLHATVDGRPVPLRRFLDRGAVAEDGGALTFVSEVIEHLTHAGRRDGAGVAVAFELRPLLGEPASAALGFEPE
jgi:hypothetical protein